MVMEKPTPTQATQLLRLAEGEELVVEGEVWTRFDDEFKVSPHGEAGDYDKDCAWVDRADVREVSHAGDAVCVVVAGYARVQVI